MQEDSRYQVPSLERALVILERLLDHPDGLTLAELTTDLNVPKNSVFRITNTLLAHGYLNRDANAKRFSLSRKLLVMGQLSLADKPIVPAAIDIMQECRDEVQETVLIGTLVESEFVVMEQVLGSHPFKFSIDLGVRLEIHVSAPGKAMLAYLTERELAKSLKDYRFVRYNEQTITSKRGLMEELRGIRECGFGLDRGEQLHGIHCVSAPIFNRHQRPVAAIWITGPEDRIPKEAFPDLGRTMRSYADQISERLL
ncbi:IclR family transcriptional regulator [Novipirellula artificiosorum]|uniref:Acetate operon repressor n=1 Tax=Novipirellula artificiosorum TaxID=2528016 RepID=A0A5C6DSJ9_9BACT|nr:IclR family transcriptional regulator [Novipirellula artificiosorum]TWU39710.1 Acetate operon repressor [Novipirellula artificiosorum]